MTTNITGKIFKAVVIANEINPICLQTFLEELYVFKYRNSKSAAKIFSLALSKLNIDFDDPKRANKIRIIQIHKPIISIRKKHFFVFYLYLKAITLTILIFL
jgi:hypothetical protein